MTGSEKDLFEFVRGLRRTVPLDGWLLASDFDGTLSEVVDEPGRAEPLPGAVDALQSLSEQVAQLAVISGRARDDLDRLLPVPGLLRLGDYGRPAPDDSDLHSLREFNARAAAITRNRPGLRLEAKPGSTSVHYRDRPEAGRGLREELGAIADRYGLIARQGRMVVEVLPKGWDKGQALRALVADARPRAVVFAGDDHGDQPCFEYLAGLALPSLAVGVRSAETDPAVFAACDAVAGAPAVWVAVLTELAGSTLRA